MLNIEDINDILSIKLLGVVPDDRNITISTNKGEPIVLDEKAVSGQAFKNIAKRITGEQVPLMNLEGEGGGLLNAFKKLFKIGG